MTFDQYLRSTLEADAPPADFAPPLQALWHERRGDWNAAHHLVADLDSRAAAWVHAYLHRREGDAGNARYWYQRAGQPVARDDLDAEWSRIAQVMVGT